MVSDRPPMVPDGPPMVPDGPPMVPDGPQMVPDQPPMVSDQPPMVNLASNFRPFKLPEVYPNQEGKFYCFSSIIYYC